MRFIRGAGLVALALVVIAGLATLMIPRLGGGPLLAVTSASLAQPVGDLPIMPEKPQPDPIGFNGCPPEGKGGDPRLNAMLNRADKGDYVPVSIDSVLALTWPKSVENQPMSAWAPSSRSFVEQYLGIPVVVEGYIVNLREGGLYPWNCEKNDEVNPYWRIYLAAGPRDDRHQAIVAVSTPQTRMGHTWTVDEIRSFLMGGRLRVRLSGWLYFNPFHPQDVGRTRATLWEITPVMQIEVYQDGKWNPLDKYGK
jgi:hypothetical protein